MPHVQYLCLRQKSLYQARRPALADSQGQLWSLPKAERVARVFKYRLHTEQPMALVSGKVLGAKGCWRMQSGARLSARMAQRKLLLTISYAEMRATTHTHAKDTGLSMENVEGKLCMAKAQDTVPRKKRRKEKVSSIGGLLKDT